MRRRRPVREKHDVLTDEWFTMMNSGKKKREEDIRMKLTLSNTCPLTLTDWLS